MEINPFVVGGLALAVMAFTRLLGSNPFRAAAKELQIEYGGGLATREISGALGGASVFATEVSGGEDQPAAVRYEVASTIPPRQGPLLASFRTGDPELDARVTITGDAAVAFALLDRPTRTMIRTLLTGAEMSAVTIDVTPPAIVMRTCVESVSTRRIASDLRLLATIAIELRNRADESALAQLAGMTRDERNDEVRANAYEALLHGMVEGFAALRESILVQARGDSSPRVRVTAALVDESPEADAFLRERFAEGGRRAIEETANGCLFPARAHRFLAQAIQRLESMHTGAIAISEPGGGELSTPDKDRQR